MTLPYKILAALVLLAAAFGAGWWTRPAEVQVKTETVTRTQEVEVIKEVVKVVKVKESKPDGTTIETETTESTTNTTGTTTSTERDKNKGTVPAPTVVTAHPQYSVGVSWRPDWREPTWQPSTITAGYRVLGNGWVEAGYDIKDNAVTVGVRVEF